MSVNPTLLYHARCLVANLRAGARLALGLPTELVSFRIALAQFFLLNALLWLVAIVDDGIATGFEGRFNVLGFMEQVAFTVLFVLAAVGLARLYRKPHLALALPVLLAAGELPIDLTHLGLTIGAVNSVVPGDWSVTSWWFFLAWFALMAGRSIAVALAPSAPRRIVRAVVGALLFAGLTVFTLYALPLQRIWVETKDSEHELNDPLPRVTSEEAWSEQPQLLDEGLAALKDGRPGVTDLYFVGFASYAAQDVFRKDVTTARTLFDQRFDTQGRSILLINNRRTLLDTPLATLSNLRATLEEIGKAMNPQEDIVFLYVSSHGSPGEVTVEFSPLELEQLTPTSLHRMLVESGIKWRVIVISACYSGSFIAPLEDEYTMVITAAQADRTSFGCGNESDFTYFGDAYFNEALRNTSSFIDAFEQAKISIAEREKKEHMSPPSNPQIFVGRAIAGKLKQFDSELAARAREGAG